jgi:hypothetical protein
MIGAVADQIRRLLETEMNSVVFMGALSVPAIAWIGSLAVAQPVWGQSAGAGDATALSGYDFVSNGYHDQTFVSLIGNTYLDHGIGLHSEVTNVNREDTGALILGGISGNRDAGSIKVMIGTSTNVQSILPQFYGRISSELRSDPSTGWIINPAYTIRAYRRGLAEQTAELRLVKYVAAGPSSSVILELIGREGFLAPGPQWIPSVLAGITFSNYKRYSVGVAVEAGKAEYNALVGVGSVNEPFVALRPSVSVYVGDRTELFVRGDYTHRTSYESFGALAGVKFSFDE